MEEETSKLVKDMRGNENKFIKLMAREKVSNILLQLCSKEAGSTKTSEQLVKGFYTTHRESVMMDASELRAERQDEENRQRELGAWWFIMKAYNVQKKCKDEDEEQERLRLVKVKESGEMIPKVKQT